MNRLLAAFQHVQWCRRTNALALDRPVIAFDLAIALRIEWACADVRHPRDLHEVLEVIRDELRTVVRDDPRTRLSVPAGIERTFPAAGMRFWNLVIPLVLPGW